MISISVRAAARTLNGEGLEFAHLDIAQPHRHAVILEADIAGQRAVFDRVGISRNVIDDDVIQRHGDLVSFDGDEHLVPFACRFRGVLGRRDAGDDSAGSVIGELGVGAGGSVEDLHLDAFLDGLLQIADLEVEAAVAFLFDLVLEFTFEILVLLLRPEISVITLPTFFRPCGSRATTPSLPRIQLPVVNQLSLRCRP